MSMSSSASASTSTSSYYGRLKKHPMSDNYRYLQLSVLKDVPQVWVVALNRPWKHNALDAPFWKEIGTLFGQIGIRREYTPCRCVLLIGHGPSFCAGIDFTDSTFFQPLTLEGDNDVARTGLAFAGLLTDMQQAFTNIEECPVPVVAAVHGNVVGAGVDLITACQVRWCCCHTTFAVKEVALGLTADVGTLQRLPKAAAANASLVHELCYTGRPFDAETALQLGLVSKVVVPTNTNPNARLQQPRELYEQALQLCCDVARHSPLAVHGTKRALLYSRDHSVRQGLEQVSAYNMLALQGPDVQTAMMAAATAAASKTTKIQNKNLNVQLGSRVEFEDLKPRARL